MMSDLEMTKLCAEAMRFQVGGRCGDAAILVDGMATTIYEPLTDDAQAMALVKKFRLLVDGGNAQWCVHGDTAGSGSINENLNRAIVESVANMQKNIRQQAEYSTATKTQSR